MNATEENNEQSGSGTAMSCCQVTEASGQIAVYRTNIGDGDTGDLFGKMQSPQVCETSITSIDTSSITTSDYSYHCTDLSAFTDTNPFRMSGNFPALTQSL